MGRNSKILLAGALGALAIILIGVFALNSQPPMSAGEPVSTALSAPPVRDEAGRTRSSSDAVAKAGASSRAPVQVRKSPATADLSIEQLIARADTGDVVAACHASRQLSDCALLKQFPADVLAKRLSESEASAASASDANSANHWATMQLGMLESLKRCSKVRPEALTRLAPLLRQSALGGNRVAMLKYSSGEFLGLTPGLEATRHPDFSIWRKEAVPMAMASLRAGSLEAAFALMTAYRSDEGAFAGIVANDLVEAHVYELVFHLAQGEPTYSLGSLTPAENDAALARAKALHAQIFAGGLADIEAGALGPTWLDSKAPQVPDPCQ